MGVVVLPQNPFEVDFLAGAIDGPFGEKVGGEGVQIVIHRQVEFPGCDALGPLVGDHGEIFVRIVRVTNEGENGIPRF